MTELDEAMEEALGPRNETSRDALVCKCGHTGHLVLKDRSSPYSCRLEFSLEGFTGAAIAAISYDYTLGNILTALSPTCPKCGGTDTVRPPEWTPEEKRKWIAAYRSRERRAKKADERQIVIEKPVR
jgi:hypothetical protein